MRSVRNNKTRDLKPLALAAAWSLASVTQPMTVTQLPQLGEPDCTLGDHATKIGILDQSNQYLKHASDMIEISSRKQMAHVFKQPNRLVSWQRNLDGSCTIKQHFLEPKVYQLVERMLSASSSEDHLYTFFRTRDHAKLKRIFMEYSGLTGDEVDQHWDRCRIVMSSAVLGKNIPGYSQWLEQISDENHPFLKGIEERHLPKGIGLTKLPGVAGPVPYNKAYRNLLPAALDRWFYIKNHNLHPIEKRTMRTEIDIREHRSRLAIIFDLLKRYSLQVARPADQDKDYFFPTETQQSFRGTHIMTTKLTAQWDISKEIAHTLNGVISNGEKLRPVTGRLRALNFLRAAPSLQPTMFSNEKADNELLNKVLCDM